MRDAVLAIAMLAAFRRLWVTMVSSAEAATAVSAEAAARFGAGCPGGGGVSRAARFLWLVQLAWVRRPRDDSLPEGREERRGLGHESGSGTHTMQRWCLTAQPMGH